MSTNLVALILGAGPRIGSALAKTFVKQGYKVAIVSRSGSPVEGVLSLKADFTDSASIAGTFDAVEKEFAAPPALVIYNAGARTVPPQEDDLFSNPAESVISDFNVNVLSAYVTAQQAVSRWTKLADDVKKTFIYTGNPLNKIILPSAATVNLGMGKSASAYWIGLADKLYQKQGYRFFYADQRREPNKPGQPVVDADAHAEFYTVLANHEGDLPWNATFMKDKGYVNFD